MHELGALVEKCRVVLIGLNYKKIAAAQPRSRSKIGRYATN